jgi:hypothetical protein
MSKMDAEPELSHEQARRVGSKMRCCMDGDSKTLPSQGQKTRQTTGWGRENGRDKEMNHKPQTSTINISTRTRTTMDERWKCGAKGGRHPKGMSEPVSLRRYHYYAKLESSLIIVTSTAGAAVVVLVLWRLVWCCRV